MSSTQVIAQPPGPLPTGQRLSYDQHIVDVMRGFTDQQAAALQAAAEQRVRELEQLAEEEKSRLRARLAEIEAESEHVVATAKYRIAQLRQAADDVALQAFPGAPVQGEGVRS